MKLYFQSPGNGKLETVAIFYSSVRRIEPRAFPSLGYSPSPTMLLCGTAESTKNWVSNASSIHHVGKFCFLVEVADYTSVCFITLLYYTAISYYMCVRVKWHLTKINIIKKNIRKTLSLVPNLTIFPKIHSPFKSTLRLNKAGCIVVVRKTGPVPVYDPVSTLEFGHGAEKLISCSYKSRSLGVDLEFGGMRSLPHPTLLWQKISIFIPFCSNIIWEETVDKDEDSLIQSPLGSRIIMPNTYL